MAPSCQTDRAWPPPQPTCASGSRSSSARASSSASRRRSTPTSRSPRSPTGSSSRGGPALLFENVKGSRHPLLINQFGTERRMCLAFGVERLDDVAARLEEVLELQPPQGLVDKVRKLGSAQVDRRLDAEVGLEGPPARRSSSRATPSTSTRLPIMRCWPLDPAPFITLPAVITQDRGDRRAERRHVPDAEGRPALDVHALADAQGRPRRPARGARRPDPGRGRARASTPSPPTRRARRSRSTSAS